MCVSKSLVHLESLSNPSFRLMVPCAQTMAVSCSKLLRASDWFLSQLKAYCPHWEPTIHVNLAGQSARVFSYMCCFILIHNKTPLLLVLVGGHAHYSWYILNMEKCSVRGSNPDFSIYYTLFLLTEPNSWDNLDTLVFQK